MYFDSFRTLFTIEEILESDKFYRIETKEISKLKYIEIANKVFNDKELSYVEFCNNYAELYNKTAENGKKIINKLVRLNLVIKDVDNKKYLINGNEISF